MEEVLWIVGPTVPVLVVGLLVFAFRRRRRRSAAEHGKEPVHTETTGARIGYVNYSFPLVEVRLYEDMLVLSAVTRAVVHFDQLERLEVARPLFISKGVCVETTDGGRHVIWAPNPERLAERIRGEWDRYRG